MVCVVLLNTVTVLAAPVDVTVETVGTVVGTTPVVIEVAALKALGQAPV